MLPAWCERRLAAIVALALTAALAGGCGSGADPSPKAHADVAADTSADAAAPCPPGAARPDGLCCPAGQFFLPGALGCGRVGPQSCDPLHPEACNPRWCADWATAAGQPCTDDAICLPQGRTCTQAELNSGWGCHAGEYPLAPGKPGCRQAGHPQQPYGMPPLANETGADDVAALAALPPPATPVWCESPAGVDGWCTPQQPTCQVGQQRLDAKCVDIAGPDWLCPAGFAVAPPDGVTWSDLPGCQADPADCGAGPFPAVPAGANVLYVDVAAAPGGNGTQKKPLTSLASAASIAAPGAIIALAAGHYPAPAEWPGQVSVIGRCAAQVTVSAPDGLPLHVTGKLKLARLALVGPGRGVLVTDGGSAELERVQLLALRGKATKATGAGSHLSLRDTVLGSGVDAGETSSACAVIDGGATGDLQRLRMRACEGYGVLVDLGSAATVVDAVIDGQRPYHDGGNSAAAVFVDGMSQVDVQNLRAHRATGSAILSQGAGDSVSLRNVRLEHTHVSYAKKNSGLGVLMFDGNLSIQGAVIDGGHGGGIVLYTGTGLIRNTVVRNIVGLETSDTQGSGMVFTGDAVVQIRDFLIRDTTYSGIAVELATVTLRNGLIEHVHSRNGGGGRGITVAGTDMELRRVRVHDSATSGISLASSGDWASNVWAQDLTVDHIQNLADSGGLGRGIILSEASAFHGERVRVSQVHTAAVSAFQPGTLLELKDFTASDIGDDGSGYFGRGLDLADGATVVVLGAYIRNYREAAAALLTNVQAHAADVAIADGHTNTESSYGDGFSMSESSTLRATGVRLLRTSECALRVLTSSTARLVGGRIADTKVGQLIAAGVAGSEDGRWVVIGSVIERTPAVGVGLWSGTGTLQETVVRNIAAKNLESRPGALPTYGYGAMVLDKSTFTGDHNLLVGCGRAGMLLDANTHVAVSYTWLMDNLFGVLLGEAMEAGDTLAIQNSKTA
ncbi:MAG: right-handed parallel beta-helix repeat-containing protein, partial [Deltaproteobacteria bacterium]|nr:right-handed parallel beta-helix repeat-containing protein [Deltaproteobacteria bacterium]